MRSAEIVFRGRRTRRGAVVEIVRRGRRPSTRPLPLRREVWDHSPCGFEWGYQGSGPAQLALAILCEVVGRYAAVELHQEVKRRLIAGIHEDSWELSAGQVLEVVAEIQAERRPVRAESEVAA